MTHPLDVSNLRQMILESPSQLGVGFELSKNVRIAGTFHSIMISGMGGSALPGNLFRIYLHDLFSREIPQEQPIQIYQNRSYSLPPESFHECLNFICSYSGNTEETIASFEEALKVGLPCIALSAGGRIEAMAKEHGVPHVKLPIPYENFQPRVGTGYFFGVMFQILVNQGMVPDTTATLLAEAAALNERMLELEGEGKKLAQKLVGKTPVIYSTAQYKSVAMVWKIKFNENAKTPAFWNFFPELNHNEMVGWTKPQGQFFVLMLRDQETHPQIIKRMTITAELLRKQGVEVEILDMEGGSVYSKIFTSIALGDLASYYLALEYGQDPTPVDMVEALKKLLT
ncbi:MAG: bifunctional phosphoglucose/phosphomannose isomerase [Candidatus Moranbacteria bacterium]|jgi:glucose/mannose-6-phosphate isomerase|nr:bifunctional phosphoglucose/phosphomannose isomerase [Candidatus Moranbacteria bacterium]